MYKKVFFILIFLNFFLFTSFAEESLIGQEEERNAIYLTLEQVSQFALVIPEPGLLLDNAVSWFSAEKYVNEGARNKCSVTQVSLQYFVIPAQHCAISAKPFQIGAGQVIDNSRGPEGLPQRPEDFPAA